MATYYDAVDLMWTDDGDFVISRNGDIADTEFDPLMAVKQDIYDRVKSDKGDYSEAPNTGATLSDFVGEKNTRENGQEIQRRIFSSLATGGSAIGLGDVSIRVFPLDIYSVAVRLELRVQPTPWNQKTTLISPTMIYSFSENHVYSVQQIPYLA